MRHIPSSPTSQQTILTFEDALRPTNDDYDRNRWIYVPDHYGEYRYLLGTRGQHPLICVGINPSTAAPGALDRTLQSVERIAANNGFDSFLMFNVYAQRATLPDDLDLCVNPRLHEENCKAFSWALNYAGPFPTVWAAWGAIIEKRKYLSKCILDFVQLSRSTDARWVTAGPRSKAGHPHHPLYLKQSSPLEPFNDLEAYLHQLSIGGS